MMWLGLALLGCSDDLLQPVVPPPEPRRSSTVGDAPKRRDLQIPSRPPAENGEAATGEQAVPVPDPEPKWNPVSIPQGPRPGTGVRWKGVKKRGTRRRELGKGEFVDE